MSRLDDRVSRELERIARPADPSRTFELIDRRRARRHILRRVQTAGLAVVVIAGTVGGFAVLRNAFREPADGIGNAPSVQNGLIVYSEVRNAGQRLWVVEPDGTRARPLTSGDGASDVGAAVSPDGQLVAFTRTDEQGSAIYVIGIDGAGLRRVTEPSWGARDPAWSPDGVELVFAGDAGDGDGLYVMAPLLEGAAPHRITERTLSAESDPSWSPDGTWIAFSASTDPAGDAEPINFDLFVTRADASGGLRNVTDSRDASDVMPSWSPDGDVIAFVTGSNALDDSPTGGIAVIRPDGSGLRQLTDDNAFELNPTWAPDGSVIAFDRDDPAGTSVYVIHPDGSDLTRIALGSDPAWQPLPAGRSPSALQSPTPTESQPVDIGLGFPVCYVSSAVGNWGGDSGTVYVATKMSDTGGCPEPGTAFEVLAVDADNDGVADTATGPILCENGCRVFGLPDIDGDLVPEIAVVRAVGQATADAPEGTEVFFDLYRFEGRGDTARIERIFYGCTNCGDPGFAWGGPGGHLDGAYCSSDARGFLFTWWVAEVDDTGNRYAVVEIVNRIDGHILRQIDRIDSHVPVDRRDLLPDGGGSDLCGYPVQLPGRD